MYRGIEERVRQYFVQVDRLDQKDGRIRRVIVVVSDDQEDGLAGPDIAERSPTAPRGRRAYQRRETYCCCICRPGETERGGLATKRVLGSTMGMALRVRCASGWCSFI